MSFVLSDAKQDKISEKLRKLRKDDCVIYRGATPDDVIDALNAEDYDAVGTIKCRVGLQNTTAINPVFGQPMDSSIPYIAAFERGEDVRQADRIGWKGKLLEVIDIFDPSIHLELKALCQKVE